MSMLLEVWWSPAAQCYRVEDGEMFTYYRLDEVVGHFVHRDRPAAALVNSLPRDVGISSRTTALIVALKNAGIPVEEKQD